MEAELRHWKRGVVATRRGAGTVWRAAEGWLGPSAGPMTLSQASLMKDAAEEFPWNSCRRASSSSRLSSEAKVPMAVMRESAVPWS